MQENVCHPVICVCDDDVENDPVVFLSGLNLTVCYFRANLNTYVSCACSNMMNAFN